MSFQQKVALAEIKGILYNAFPEAISPSGIKNLLKQLPSPQETDEISDEYLQKLLYERIGHAFNMGRIEKNITKSVPPPIDEHLIQDVENLAKLYTSIHSMITNSKEIASSSETKNTQEQLNKPQETLKPDQAGLQKRTNDNSVHITNKQQVKFTSTSATPK